jgi:hypothetical protein
MFSAAIKERDPELELLEMEFEGLSENEKEKRKRVEQRKQILMKLCQRLFVGFVGIFNSH